MEFYKGFTRQEIIMVAKEVSKFFKDSPIDTMMTTESITEKIKDRLDILNDKKSKAEQSDLFPSFSTLALKLFGRLKEVKL